MQILTDSSDFVGAGNLSWQQHMKAAIRTPEALIERLELPENLICRAQSKGPFPLFVPLPFLSRIEKGNENDPLLRQVLPLQVEAEPISGFTTDPLNESDFVMSPGLLRKYNERALLIVNGSCAVHCRYCFRRHFPYSDATQDPSRLDDSIGAIQNDTSIREVILSGGDPLTLADERLDVLVQRLNRIEHLERLRIHSRLPIVIPQRVNDRLLSMISNSTLDVVFVVHCNHANELDKDVKDACRKLGVVCASVLNQSVLLRGVNDCVESLKMLSEALVSCRVVPYYLHQLDAVSGAAHFLVPVDQGIKLIQKLRESVSGYLVPRYVQEIPGCKNKTPLA